jgi:hypothetical protein
VGQQVTILVKGTVGTVLFIKARYDAEDLVPTGTTASEVSFTIAEGRRVFEAVYVFSAGAAGRGELHEKCSEAETQLLDDNIRGDNEVKRLRICGQGG